MSRPHQTARLTAVALGVVYAITLHVSGVALRAEVRTVLRYLPTVAVLGVVIFDVWLWRLPGIQRLAGRPRIDGTWVTTLSPDPESHIPEKGNRGPIDAAVLIEQTYWTIAVTLLTEESRSESTSAAVRRTGDSKQRQALNYTYVNTPKQEHRSRSRPHVGASRLEVAGLTPSCLTGTYWTDRLTAGDMALRRVSRRTDYASLAEVLTAVDGQDATEDA